MKLSCECGNKSDFVEETVTSWNVDGEGNREEKVDEQTRYFCIPCNQDAEVCET